MGGGYSIIMTAYKRGGVLSIKMCTYVNKGFTRSMQCKYSNVQIFLIEYIPIPETTCRFFVNYIKVPVLLKISVQTKTLFHFV